MSRAIPMLTNPRGSDRAPCRTCGANIACALALAVMWVAAIREKRRRAKFDVEPPF